MKILVTGATGFVGSHLCEILQGAGHEVYALARSEKKFQEFAVPGKLILGELKTNGEHAWSDQLPPQLDAVVHTAGIVHSFNTADFYNTNTLASENLIRNLQTKYPMLHFILISSLSAAGPTRPGTKSYESDTAIPITHYGKSKLAAEQALHKLAPTTWKKTIIRPPMVIGPRDPAILDIFRLAKKGWTVLAGKNALNNTYSFVCVHDLVQAISQAIVKPRELCEIYYTAHPTSITFNELITKIHGKVSLDQKLRKITLPINLLKATAQFLKIIGKFYPHGIRLTPDKIPELSATAWICSAEKSITQLDMNYLWDIDKTIDITLADYRQRNWLS